MKKFYLLTKTLLVAALLMVGANAWAGEVTTLYEKGTTGHDWAAADLTDWTTTSSVALSLTGGVPTFTANNVNPGPSYTKTISPTSDAIVTLNASIYGAVVPNRDSSYDYIKIGGVSFRLWGNNKKATIDIEGTETELATNITRGADYTIKIVINTATHQVTYAYNGGDDVVAATLSTAAIGNVELGHYRGGREGAQYTVKLNSISVTNETQEVSTADYTINYKYGGETIKSVNGNTAVGATVYAESPITISDTKYFATSATSMVIAASDNILDVTLRLAETYNYTVNCKTDETFLKEITSGSVVEGASVSYKFPHYLLLGTNLYKRDQNSSNPWYGNTFTPTTDGQEEVVNYTDAEVANVVYLVEAEDLLTATSAANADIRCSGGQGGYSSENVEATTLAPGKYKITGAVWGNEAETIKVFDGNETIFWSATTAGYWAETTSDMFILNEETTLYVVGGNSSKCLDYIYIQKLPDNVSATITSAGYATFSSAYPVEIPVGVEAYAAKLEGDKVTLTKVDAVPANTGVILKAAEGVYDLPVAASAAAIANNDLQISNGSVTGDESTIYVLGDGKNSIGFYWLKSGNTLEAGKAYLEIKGGLARGFIGFEGATGINEVNVNKAAAKTGKIYNLNGQIVSKPSKGLFIVDGKVVSF